ncbi:uncharacterized protein LOC143912563 [Arctopsyche grandis]|uniref:uncharacterized protein LOC143912563 n=1 Tax=Arctopsyche grandis TaxID=121162 RepID=UPI00406D9969
MVPLKYGSNTVIIESANVMTLPASSHSTLVHAFPTKNQPRATPTSWTRNTPCHIELKTRRPSQHFPPGKSIPVFTQFTSVIRYSFLPVLSTILNYGLSYLPHKKVTRYLQTLSHTVMENGVYLYIACCSIINDRAKPRKINSFAVAPFKLHHRFRMSREKSQEPPTSSAENLLSGSGASTENIDNNAYLNPAATTHGIPSSPPPSYQHVIEETRLTALTNYDQTPVKSRLHSSKRSSFDSISQNSNPEQSTPTRSSFVRRANTISTDDSSYSNGNESKFDENCSKLTLDDQEKEVDGSEADLLSNAAPSEISLWQDYQEPSTSYDASSRQLDNDSVKTLAVSQMGDRDSDDQDTYMYESIDNYEEEATKPNNDYNRNKKKTPVRQKAIIEVVANKTSKVMYAALAKELGLQCSMSDQCRCVDCQGGYLRCGDADGDTGGDGGLGAGTPMFVSEAFGHGIAPACQII